MNQPACTRLAILSPKPWPSGARQPGIGLLLGFVLGMMLPVASPSHSAIAKPPRAPLPSTTKLPADAPAETPFPTQGLLPKQESGALRLLAAHPELDGRGVVVGVLDTGVDPGVASLQTTSDGRPKLIDLIDATGSGDIDTRTVRRVERKAGGEPATIQGLSGRTLRLSPNWLAADRPFHIGLARGYALFPDRLVSRLRRERRRPFELAQAAAEADLRRQIVAWDAEHPRPSAVQQADRDNLAAAWDELVAARDYDDPGPLFDCLLFHDGRRWQAVVDTDEDGDLAEERLLTDYRVARQQASFGEPAALNFAVNIYEQGNRLSIVVDSTPHGTHVAGIIAAYDPENPLQSGIAPGAQVVSIKIGDTRLSSMETGAALERGVIAAVRAGCQVVNMSYGEPVAEANRGRLIRLLSELADRHNIVFVAAAGNNGPALSTVIAPGGTSSSVIGVAAYLSPEMMQTQYTLRTALAEMPYPWSSRGPAADGDLGVDLFAPGGAIAPVSHWTQQQKMQMNGTSMASPSAAGAVALLVSAARQQQLKYTPTSIRRALQNTARPIAGASPFEQGPGLIQVDRALAYLSKHQGAPLEQIPLAVRCSRVDDDGVGRSKLRGIYLREPGESAEPSSWRIDLEPEFPEATLSGERIAAELSLQLTATADWITCGKTLLLNHGRESFEVEIDPRKLPPGAHYGEVQANDAARPERGPLARVAVTVIRPERLTSEAGRPTHREKLSLSAGGLARRFFAVPAGATWADIRLASHGATGTRSFLLHTHWLHGGPDYRDASRQQRMTLDGPAAAVRTIPVTAGTMLEVCLGQDWTSLGESELELEIVFHSLLPDNAELRLSAGSPTAHVRLQACLGGEPIAPSAKLTTRRTLLRPAGAELTPLTAERDQLPDGRQFYQLLLTYRFEQAEPGKVTPRLPGLDGRLYEAEGASFLWQLFDAGRRRVASDDIWPSEVKLERGQHTLRLALRHTDADWLDKAREQVLCLDRPLAKPLALTVQGMTPGERDATGQLAAGQSLLLAVEAPAAKQLPADLSAGEELLGAIQYGRDDPLQEGRGYRPDGWSIRYAAGPPVGARGGTQRPAADDDPRPLAQRLAAERLAARVAQLDHLMGEAEAPEFEKLAEQILRRHPQHQPVLVARLKRLDSVAHRKERLDEVIAAADAVLATIDQDALAVHFGRQPPKDDPAAERQHQEFVKQRDLLIDTLYRKGRAIGYRELPEVLAARPIADQQAQDAAFAENFSALARWADTTSAERFLLHIRRDRRRGHFGAALALLNRRTKDLPPNYWHTKKRRDLFQDLGWNHLAEYEARWMLVRFPSEFDLP